MKTTNKQLGDVVLSAAFAALLFVQGEEAFAHTRFKLDSTVLTPRNDNDGLKTGPCGGVARTASPKVFTPGQMIEVAWVETVDHIGSYRIAFSPANDENFDSNVLYTTNDVANVHDYKAAITLPMQICDACTLQLIQIMGAVATPTNQYYSCADIKIVADTTGSTPPPPVPSDTKQFAQQLLNGFASTDKNGNGLLSIDEIQVIYTNMTIEQFNALDKAADGYLSKADLDAIINPTPPPAPAPNPGSSSGGSSNTGSTKQEEKTTAGSFDWSLLLLFAAYYLVTRRDRRRIGRARG